MVVDPDIVAFNDEKLADAVLYNVAVEIGSVVSHSKSVSQYSFTSFRPVTAPVEVDAVTAIEVTVVASVVVSLNAPPIYVFVVAAGISMLVVCVPTAVGVTVFVIAR